jgi:hypothetical protein
MATDLTISLRDVMLDAAGADVVSLSLHTAQPDATGSAEVTGGTYARQTVTWLASASAVLVADGDVTWDVPGGNTVTWCGLWAAGSAWRGAIELSSPEEFASPGQYVATVVSVALTNQP